MIDRRADNAIEEAAADGGILLNFRDMGWTGRLAWYLRAMACVSMLKGLYHWAAVCGIIGEEGGFEAHVQSWQATTVYFAVIDLVAAVGLWLMAPWGVTPETAMLERHAIYTFRGRWARTFRIGNAFLAGETTMMGKEHFIETFGVPDFTVSIGSSGGAYRTTAVGR